MSTGVVAARRVDDTVGDGKVEDGTTDDKVEVGPLARPLSPVAAHAPTKITAAASALAEVR